MPSVPSRTTSHSLPLSHSVPRCQVVRSATCFLRRSKLEGRVSQSVRRAGSIHADGTRGVSTMMPAERLWWGENSYDVPGSTRVEVLLQDSARVSGSFRVEDAGRGRQTVTNRTLVALRRVDGCPHRPRGGVACASGQIQF